MFSRCTTWPGTPDSDHMLTRTSANRTHKAGAVRERGASLLGAGVSCTIIRRAFGVLTLLVALTFGACNEESDLPPTCTGNKHCAGVSMNGVFAEMVGKWELFSVYSYTYGYEGDDVIYRHRIEIFPDGSFLLDNDNGIIQAGCFNELMHVLPEDTTGLNYYSLLKIACTNEQYLREDDYRLRIIGPYLLFTGYFIWSQSPNHGAYITYKRR
jgi:hypothetical protein